MRSPSDPSSPAMGRLFVTGPHIAAELVVLNHRLEPVGKGVGALEPLTLPPGLYDVQANLGGTTAYCMVKLEPGGKATVAKSDWKAEALEFSSAAPLAGTSTRHEGQSDPAMQWSRQPTWTPSGAGARAHSRLFLFVRTLNPKKDQRYFAEGLELLDCDGRALTKLAGTAVQASSNSGWMAFCADLPAGPYLLHRRPGHGIRARYQPLYLCSGWETQVFVPSGKQPSLRKLSLIYAPRGEGFVPDDAQDQAAEAVVSGLRRGLNLATGTQMRQLLEDKLNKPWLGVLAAHAMRLPPPQIESEDRIPGEPAESPTYKKEDASLFQHVVERIAGALGDHPDVRALLLPLTSGATRFRPCPFPPLLQASLSLIRQSEARLGCTLIPPDSLTDCLLDRLYTNSVWTGWAPLTRAPRPLTEFNEQGTLSSAGTPSNAANAADVVAEVAAAEGTGPLDALRGKGPRRLLKRATSAARSDQESIDVEGVLAFVALHCARLVPLSRSVDSSDALTVALAALRFRGGEPGASIGSTTGDNPKALAVLLEDLEAETLCRVYGLPRARAQQLTEQLRSDGHGFVSDLLGRRIESLGPDEQAVVDALKQRLASDPFDAAAALDSLIQQIGTALRRLKGSESWDDWMEPVRDDLERASRRLACRASLLAVTTTSDKPLYESPAFAALGVGIPDPWREVPPGRVKTLPMILEASTSGERKSRITYRVSRAAVEDRRARSILGWIYHASPAKPLLELEALSTPQRAVTCILTSLELLDYQAARNPEGTEEHRRNILEAVQQLLR